MTHGNMRLQPDPGFPILPGVNVQAAVERLNNNLRMYTKLLRNFLLHQQRTPALYAAALKEGDAQAAKIAVHTLKGLAATVGAGRLYTLAFDLEKMTASAPDSADTEAKAKECFDELRSLLTVISSYLDSEQA